MDQDETYNRLQAVKDTDTATSRDQDAIESLLAGYDKHSSWTDRQHDFARGLADKYSN